MNARSLLASIPLLALACAVPVAASGVATEPRSRGLEASAPVEWPVLLAAERDGPSMHRGSGTDARGFAWIGAGTPVELRGEVRDGRVRANVDGPLRVRGWIDVAALEAVVLTRGRVAGSPLYLAPGDTVRLVRVEGELAVVRAEALIAHPALSRSPAFEGTLPLERLGASMAGSGAGPTPGRAVVLRRATELTGRPGGRAIWSIPALDPPLAATVLREDGDQLGVRIGNGPYLVGFVPRSALAPDVSSRKGDSLNPEVLDPWGQDDTRARIVSPLVADPWAREPAQDEDAGEEEADELGSTLPARLARAVVRPVWAVRRGARVRVDGAVVAVFHEPGSAVELERFGDHVEVLAAVDDSVTVRGLVAIADLSSPTPVVR